MMILPDRPARRRAVTAEACNLVVTAGAGTGKTTLLVDRLVHLLLERAEPLTIGEIVALTFTNKAADEMKVRLRARLADLPHHDRAAAALRELEKSQIGTIHSFAAHLLRLFPIESGVDPSFQQDEGRRFDEFFRREWLLWLDQELGPAGRHHDVWTAALHTVTLDELQQLTRGLAGELIPLDDHLADLSAEACRQPLKQWVKGLAETARMLRAAHAKANTLERMLDEAASYCDRVLEKGLPRALPPALDREVPPQTTQWTREEYRQARRVIKIIQTAATVRPDPLQGVVQLVIPFARDCRRRFVQTGYISFDGLVARARDLLRDHPAIRRELKAQFRSILVDEFQDTDPVQYEMILYLAEAPGEEARDWRHVRLEPGKLFIVGDPKQSIYAFRRADMEAYDAVVDDHVLPQIPPGERHTLTTNFRSHAGLLTAINACFARIFPGRPIKGLQPQHDPLQAPDADAPQLADERMHLRVVRAEDPEADADTVGRMEAEELARWLREDVLGREQICEQGVPVPIKPGHIAMLFRTLTDMRDYVEALRRYAIPCLTEGEKHFYERQEVVDAINVLRAAVDPHDRLALVAVLRSPLGALTDAEIERLARFQMLNARLAVPPASVDPQVRAAYEAAMPVYALLRDLTATLPRLPLTEIMEAVFARAPLLELAAASIDGEQAVANVLKLRDVVVESAKRTDLTLAGLVGELTKRALDPPDEAESSLAEDTDGQDGYVRLLSIHKAKGLEFPVVILTGLQRGTNRMPSPIMVHHDWSTGIVGMRVGHLRTLGGVYLEDKLAERQRAEQSRVLYVAMTRAKRRLVLSAGMPKQPAGDSFLSMIADGLGMDPDALGREAGTVSVPIDGADVQVEVVTGKTVPLQVVQQHGIEWREVDDDVSSWQARWAERKRRRDEVTGHPAFISPTLLKRRQDETAALVGRVQRRTSDVGSDMALWIGIVAHRVLETWNFDRDPDGLPARIDEVCRAVIPETVGDIATITEELNEMFGAFAKSAIYTSLRSAAVIGREVPFSMPWPPTPSPAAARRADLIEESSLHIGTQISFDFSGTSTIAVEAADGPAPVPCVMEGVIDLLCRVEGRVWVMDYKTDHVEEDEVAARAEDYRLQADVYKAAVAQCLGLDDVACRLIFLRTGTAVEM